MLEEKDEAGLGSGGDVGVVVRPGGGVTVGDGVGVAVSAGVGAGVGTDVAEVAAMAASTVA